MKALLAASLTLFCALAIAPAPARAQIESREGIQLENEVAELRQQLQGLRDQLARTPPAGGSSLGGYQAPPPPAGATSDATAQLLDRVLRLEDEVRALRGRIDEVDNARQRQAEDLGKQIGDLNFKIDNGAAGGAPTPGAPPPTRPRPAHLSPPPGNLGDQGQPGNAGPNDVPPPPPPPPVRRTPEMILQEGNAAYLRKDFPAAEAAAKAVLAAGTGPRTTDAQYLMARALYGKRDFSGAAVAFDDTYNRGRTGSHAQEALLGLAASLNAIAEKRAACQTLDKLATEFPNLRPDLRVPVATMRRDAGCH